MKRYKLDVELVRQCLTERVEHRGKEAVHEEMRQLQTVVYVMCGGGFLGSFAANQPADFYIDARVSRRPYPATAIYQAVATLKEYALVLGLNPHKMPEFTAQFHNCGVF